MRFLADLIGLPVSYEHHEPLEGRRRRGGYAARARFAVRLERLPAATLRALRRERHRRERRFFRCDFRVRYLDLGCRLLAQARRSSFRRRRGRCTFRHRRLSERIRRREPLLPVLHLRHRGRRGRRVGVHSSYSRASQVVPGQARPSLRPSGDRLWPRAGHKRPSHLDYPLGDRWPFNTFAVLGISYAVLIGAAAWFVRNPLKDREPADSERRDQVDEKPVGTSYYLRGAVGTWQWYALWVVFLLNTTQGVAVYSDAKAMADSIGGATAAVASGFVMIVALSDTAGRLVWPILSDKIGGANVFLAMFLVQAAAFLLMPVLGAGSFALFCVLASAVVSCYGGGYATMSALAAAYYGPRDIGTIYGGILTASSVAGFGAPLLLAHSADVTGSYDLALYATGLIMLVGAVIPLTLKAPHSDR